MTAIAPGAGQPAERSLSTPASATTPPLRARPDWASRIGGGVGLLVVLFVAQDLLRKQAFQWNVVWQYLFNAQVLGGVWTTIKLTVVSMAVGLVLSVIIAQMRTSTNPVLSRTAAVYVWLFRAIPLLVLLIVVYNIGLLYPTLQLGVPFGGPKATHWDIQSLVTPFIAAVLAFSVHEAAYGSEVVRAALMSVPRGQVEAAESLGMTHFKIMRRIVIPQAMRIAIPPLANNTISMVKGTALVAFIAVPDLLYSVQKIYLVNYEIIPLLMVATIWYLAIVTVLSLAQHWLEVRFGGHTRTTTPSRRRLVGRKAAA